MIETEFYVRNKKTGVIVNCVTSTSREGALRVLAGMVNPHELYLDASPPRHILEQYEYWSKRP